MPSPFKINEGFTPNMRTNIAAFLNQHYLEENPLTATKTGFTQGGKPLADKEVLDLFLLHCFEATASVRGTILSALFGS